MARTSRPPNATARIALPFAWVRLLAGCALDVVPAMSAAQEMKLPKDIDFGGSGLVQFRYTCAGTSCGVRCFMTGNVVLDVKEAKAATFTSYRSHSRQNAPEKEIFVTTKADEPHYINFAGDGGCVFSGMRQESTTGFVSRTSIGTPTREAPTR